MGRRKSYSSTLSGITASLKINLDNLNKFSQEELPNILADAEAYQELKPVIEKLTRPVDRQEKTDQGHNDEEKSKETGQDQQPDEPSDEKTGQDQQPDEPSAEKTGEQKPPARSNKKKGQKNVDTSNQEPGINS
jgi:cobalamin biosynthesis protein CobT